MTNNFVFNILVITERKLSVIFLTKDINKMIIRGDAMKFLEKGETELAVCYMIEPYFIKKYLGTAEIENGILRFFNWNLEKQIPCISVDLPPIIGREEWKKENPGKKIMKDLHTYFETTVYIVNGLDSSTFYYCQEKDENGIYRTQLEAISYVTIPLKKENSKVEKVYQLF